jgi:cis-3-alkyl-4-acyloxetan-2-one decarboxylase
MSDKPASSEAKSGHTPPALPGWLRELYPFEPKRFDTGSGHMSYLDEGQGDEAVVMVHGNPTWSFFYRNVVLALRGRVRCIVPDHLGCGLSDKPQEYDYTLHNHVGNLGRLIDSLSLRKIHLIVHDWGGPIGLGVGLPRHEKLGKVVILNTAAFADTVVPRRIRACRIPVFGELAVRGLNGFAWPATWMAVTKPLPDPVKRGFLFPYDSWANRIATHRFVRDIPQGCGAPNDLALAEVEKSLPLLAKHPVRIIWGGADFCFNRHYFERWSRLLPSAHATYLPETGHYLLEDDRTTVLALISAHIP